MSISLKRANIYKAHGIEVSNGKLITPDGYEMTEPLQEGNDKLGKVWTWSTLPTNGLFDTKYGVIAGTCKCSCKGCYAMRGHYNHQNTRDALAIRTYVSRKWTNWLYEAICAQIETIPENDRIRVSAAGDVEDQMIPVWKDILRRYPRVTWTYTKNEAFKDAFNEFRYANIVKSIIDGYGYNFGHIDHVLGAYLHIVRVLGKVPYICRCGIDKNQHCDTCDGCSRHEYVLFGEHSTEYKIKKDPMFKDFERIVEMQKNHSIEDICREIERIL